MLARISVISTAIAFTSPLALAQPAQSEPAPAPDSAAGQASPALTTAAPAQATPEQVAPAVSEPLHTEPTAEASTPAAAPLESDPSWVHEAPPREDNGELAKNSIFFEGLGPGVYYSINYERLLGADVGLRVGLGLVTVNSSSPTATTLASIPINLTWSGVRRKKHAFEVHGGGTIIITSGAIGTPGGTTSSAATTSSVFNLGAGYRLHPVEGVGFQFRAGLDLTAWLIDTSSATTNLIAIPWPYVSFGAGF